MKYLYLAFLLFTTTAAIAQNKPSKEETIKYIDTWFQNNIVGGRFQYDWTGSSASFDGKTIAIKRSRTIDGTNYTSETIIRNINWALCLSNDGVFLTDPPEFLNFSTSHMIDYHKSGVNPAQERMTNYISLKYVLPQDVSQAELAKLEKAIAHLVTLSKEESKNSYFDN